MIVHDNSPRPRDLSPALHIAVLSSELDSYIFLNHVTHAIGDNCCVEHYALEVRALAAFRKSVPDCIIISTDLADGTFLDCAARLRRLFPTVYIAISSLNGGAKCAFQSLTAGASAYLTHPLEASEVIAFIHCAKHQAPFLCKRTQDLFVKALHKSGLRCSRRGLSKRQEEVLASLVLDSSDKGVAEALHISPTTAHTHIFNVLKTLGVHSRNHAIRRYLGIE